MPWHADNCSNHQHEPPDTMEVIILSHKQMITNQTTPESIHPSDIKVDTSDHQGTIHDMMADIQNLSIRTLHSTFYWPTLPPRIDHSICVTPHPLTAAYPSPNKQWLHITQNFPTLYPIKSPIQDISTFAKPILNTALTNHRLLQVVNRVVFVPLLPTPIALMSQGKTSYPPHIMEHHPLHMTKYHPPCMTKPHPTLTTKHCPPHTTMHHPLLQTEHHSPHKLGHYPVNDPLQISNKYSPLPPQQIPMPLPCSPISSTCFTHWQCSTHHCHICTICHLHTTNGSIKLVSWITKTFSHHHTNIWPHSTHGTHGTQQCTASNNNECR